MKLKLMMNVNVLASIPFRIVSVLYLGTLLVSCEAAFACIWVSGTSLEGKPTVIGKRNPVSALRRVLESGGLRARGIALEKRIGRAGGFAERRDLAVAKILQGRYQSAVDQLLTLEEERPGDYAVAANLGTALELLGNNVEALTWIEEGIGRNPTAHHGTEWLHVAILRAKIELEKDVGFLETRSLLNLDLDSMTSRETPIFVAGADRELAEIGKALDFQLRERLQFVKTNDPIVASLLFDYSIVVAASHTVEAALELLDLGEQFGLSGDRSRLLRGRYERLVWFGRWRRWATYSALFAGVVIALWVALRKGWLVVRRESTPESAS